MRICGSASPSERENETDLMLERRLEPGRRTRRGCGCSSRPSRRRATRARSRSAWTWPPRSFTRTVRLLAPCGRCGRLVMPARIAVADPAGAAGKYNLDFKNPNPNPKDVLTGDQLIEARSTTPPPPHPSQHIHTRTPNRPQISASVEQTARRDRAFSIRAHDWKRSSAFSAPARRAVTRPPRAGVQGLREGLPGRDH